MLIIEKIREDAKNSNIQLFIEDNFFLIVLLIIFTNDDERRILYIDSLNITDNIKHSLKIICDEIVKCLDEVWKVPKSVDSFLKDLIILYRTILTSILSEEDEITRYSLSQLELLPSYLPQTLKNRLFILSLLPNEDSVLHSIQQKYFGFFTKNNFP